MIQYRPKVRKDTPQRLVYVFRDQNKAVIDLGGYTSVSFQAKRQGATNAAVSADFVSKPAGSVSMESYTFAATGLWHAQFFCTHPDGHKLYGEPIEITVVPNTNDLGTDDGMSY